MFSSKRGKFKAELIDQQHQHLHYYIIIDEVDGLQEAEGSIKFDGCSNWDFQVDACLLHFCGPNELKDFYQAVNDCYMHSKQHFDVDDNWDMG